MPDACFAESGNGHVRHLFVSEHMPGNMSGMTTSSGIAKGSLKYVPQPYVKPGPFATDLQHLTSSDSSGQREG